MKLAINKSKTLVLAFLICSASASMARQAEEEKKYGWTKSIVAGLNVTQVSFDNWVQGGDDAFAWQLNVNSKFVNDQEKTNWATSGKLTYGRTKVGDQGSRKSVDEIKIETVFTYKLGDLVNPFVAATGLTQFADGFQYDTDPPQQTSAFFDPAFFTQSVGFGYKASESFSSRVGFALKETITRDFPQPYADDPATQKIEKTKVEAGLESSTELSQKLSKNILLNSKLELFSNLEAFDETDVNWDNTFSAKVSKYIDVNFNVRVLYDKDIDTRRQIKQALAIGLTYTFL